MRCGAGVPPAFLQRVEIEKIAGETPAPQETPVFLEASCLGFQQAG